MSFGVEEVSFSFGATLRWRNRLAGTGGISSGTIFAYTEGTSSASGIGVATGGSCCS